ncbi:hypothetical protein [Actinacidiphila bryophytorum]|uniref:hypothetical protein n=1 Tax=Actinacidiphila bryophytorum TaxID=1436133 RepID=UPI002176CA86|nr:hypothetical protein [Actinacidiphila bryophytorum]UWE09136.1 hypothetical protein NYE86_10660 [Actinacidiphila bryophytorum]
MGWPARSWTRVSAPRGSQLTRVAPTFAASNSTAAGVSSPPRVQGRTSGTPDSGPPEVATTRLSAESGSSAASCPACTTSSRTSSRRRPAGPGPSARRSPRRTCSTGTGVPSALVSRTKQRPSG